MDPIITGSLIGAGSSIVGDIANLFGQSKANKQSQAFQVGMYNRQRSDALADFNMQNAYNSPTAQMDRLKAAGLNPNLVYGKGADAGMAAPIRSSSPGSYTAKFPELKSGQEIGGIAMQAAQQMLQKRNLDQQAYVQAAQIQKLGADAAKSLADTDLTKVKVDTAAFDLAMKQALKNATLTGADLKNELLGASVDNTRARTTYILDENERREALTAQNLQTAAVHILVKRMDMAKSQAEQDEIRARIENLKKTGVIQDFEIDLNKRGMTKGDNTWLRILDKLLDVKEHFDFSSPDALKRALGVDTSTLGKQIRAGKGFLHK